MAALRLTDRKQLHQSQPAGPFHSQNPYRLVPKPASSATGTMF